MAQITFKGNKGKVPVTVDGVHVTLHVRRYRDKKTGKYKIAVGSRHIRLTKGKPAA